MNLTMAIKNLGLLLLGLISFHSATATHETPVHIQYSTPRPPPPPKYLVPVNVIVTASHLGYHLSCENADVYLTGILGTYVTDLYIMSSAVDCSTAAGSQIILRFYTEDQQKANVVADMLAEKAWEVAHVSGAPCDSIVSITTYDKAVVRSCTTDSQFCCKPPPPPPPQARSPPPPPPPPPYHYIKDCPPPPHYLPNPTYRRPPPTSHKNPPPPYNWANRQPSHVPCNGHCNPNALYRAVTVRAPKCWGNMYLSPLYVDTYLCPSLESGLKLVLATYGIHESVDYSIKHECIVNYHVSNNYVYYKLELYMSPEAWVCLYNAAVRQDSFALLVHESHIICGSSFRIYDAPPESSMLVYNDNRNQPSLDAHDPDQAMCELHPDPHNPFYRYLNDHP